VRTVEIDGVRILLTDEGPGSAAVLTFGGGSRAETLDTAGITALLLDLALRPLGRVDDLEISVDATTAQVQLPQPPDQLPQLIARICAGLAEPPLNRLGEVTGDVDPADRYVDFDLTSPLLDAPKALLSRMFGATGAGLLRWTFGRYPTPSATQLREHARRHFAAGNAVLALNSTAAAVLPELRLPLPPGPRVEYPPAWPAPRSGPTWYADAVSRPALAMVTQPGLPALAALRVLTRRVNAALKESGSTPRRARLRADPWSLVLDRERLVIGVLLTDFRWRTTGRGGPDPAPAIGVLLRELRRLVEVGVDAADLAAMTTDPGAARRDFARLLRSEEVADRVLALGGLALVGARELVGAAEEYPDEEIARLPRLDPARVSAVLRAAEASALLVVPAGTRVPELPELTCPTGAVASPEPVRPSLLGRLTRAGRHGRLEFPGSTIRAVAADGRTHDYPLTDVLAVLDGKRYWLADTRHGCAAEITGYAGVERLRTLVPPQRLRVSS
jgi:hypothetical protein